MKRIIVILLSVPLALACQEYYNNDDPVVIQDAIANPLGADASCNVTTYRNATVINSDFMVQVGLAYNHSLGVLAEATYESIIFCNTSTGLNFTGNCKFKVIDVEPDDDLAIVKANQDTIYNDTNWTVGYFQDESTSAGFWQKFLDWLIGGAAW